MNINAILAFLKPKENKFFPMIKAIGDNLLEGGVTFKKLVDAKDIEEARAIKAKMKELEVNGDALLNNVLFELNNTFITPFDREDIHNLCESLDNVLDILNSLGKRIVLYQPRILQSHLVKSSDIVLECCKALQIICSNLHDLQKHPDVLLEQCKKLHSLEQEGDDLYDATIAKVFGDESISAVELIKDKGVLSYVENTIDETYTVSKQIKNMIVKYA